jgi:hypothetical protein
MLEIFQYVASYAGRRQAGLAQAGGAAIIPI